MRKVLYIMGQLNDDDVHWMAQSGRRLALANGEVIIRQGVEAADLFIVLAGAVEVQVAGAGVVARLAKGEVLGEMSFVDRTPPSATVRAAGPATVLALNKQAMEGRLARDVGFSARFYKALAIYLADRLRETNVRQTGATALDSSAVQEDELDASVLDQVSMAGIRFEHMLKTLMGAQAG